MKLNLTSDSAQILDYILDGVDALSDALRSQYDGEEYDKNLNNTTGIIYEMLMGTKDDSDTLVQHYASFLCKVSLLAYHQMLDSDKDLESIKASIKDTEGIGTDFKFGFNGLSDVIYACMENLKAVTTSESSVKQSMESNMLAQIRTDVEAKDYFETGCANKDIKLVQLLSEKSKSAVSDFMRTLILESSDAYKRLYSTTVKEIMGVYKYLFQDSFGLNPYFGVISFSRIPVRVINENFRYDTVSSCRLAFDRIATALKKHYNVTECGERQFDICAILDSKDDDAPLYYPMKILEYAMGRELTYNLSASVYKPYAKTDSWEDYAKGYVKPQVEKYVFDTIYETLERYIKSVAKSTGIRKFLSYDINKLHEKAVDEELANGTFSFTCKAFNDLVSDEEDAFTIEKFFNSEACGSAVQKSLRKLEKTLCTGVVITSYNSFGNQMNAVKIRMVNTAGRLSSSESIAKDLFGGVTVGDNITYEKGICVSEGKTFESAPLPFEIYEYGHDYDSAISNAEPLFGYKAVELYMKRQIRLGFDKILIGYDTKGTPLFASSKDPDDIPMQQQLVHNMMAGSRSGKGVMTMNILASALASNKPIFYIDRKPDMAVMFYELSQGNMFVINGGQYEPKNDPRKHFNDKGDAISGWSEHYDSMPEYLKSSIFTSRTYAGDFGDYVYARAVIFVLGILLARGESAANPDILSHLGGKAGIVIVVDEFKNWQQLFEVGKFTSGGTFGNEHVFKEKDKYKKIKQNIEMYESQLSTADEGEAAKLQEKLTKAKIELSHMVSPIDVYCMTVMTKLKESLTYIKGKSSAALAETEKPISDIFLIGQDIEVNPITTGITEMANGGYNTTDEFKKGSYFRGIFNSLWHDWFMGYNQDTPSTKKYMGCEEAGSRSQTWITKKSYWAYIRSASMETLRTSEPDGAKYFKAYLVLNNNMEDDPSLRPKITVTDKNGKISEQEVVDPDYTFVDQCRKRVNDAVPGANLWEQVRLKHLPPEKAEEARSGVNKHYGELNEGIGFAGLASLTKQCTGKDSNGNPIPAGAFDPVADLGVSGEIANWVARRLGYSDYHDFLFDFSPRGLFSVSDISRAIQDPSYWSNYKARLPLFDTYGVSIDDTKSDGEAPLGRTSEGFGESRPNGGGFSFTEAINPIPVTPKPTSMSSPVEPVKPVGVGSQVAKAIQNARNQQETGFDFSKSAYENTHGADAGDKLYRFLESRAKVLMRTSPKTAGVSEDDPRYKKMVEALINYALSRI